MVDPYHCFINITRIGLSRRNTTARIANRQTNSYCSVFFIGLVFLPGNGFEKQQLVQNPEEWVSYFYSGITIGAAARVCSEGVYPQSGV